MRGGTSLAPLLILAAAFLACVDIPTDTSEVFSLQVNALPSPSVVVGDTLRDSSGVVKPITFTAFNFEGDEVSDFAVRFRALDARIKVDSITGFVVGDSTSTTPSRVLAMIDGFNATISIPVVPRPDTVRGSNERDSIAYSLADTTLNVSPAIGVRVVHGVDSAVPSYLVTFAILSDTAIARLVDETGSRSSADTTDANGIASRRVRINVARLTSAVDSVIIQAGVKYRGQHVRGSPMRLVVTLKPR